ncbi:MAG: glycerol-3-phosphate 1-O-acyltransferase [Alphaproteobacteria bacterium]|nr:glycerol-3-phosphate 1-O-acyltransferase [Alphaproteobacteria bacterium]PHX98928.1 MAG: acyl-phosphate glycerol 3-phosphate acyltransferase [Rhodospirillaceae bacterium]
MTPAPTELTLAAEIVALLIGYGFGSLPFGLVITRMAGLGDIRSIGSGNIGATNVLRTGRKDLALATLLLDSGKGAIAVIIVRLLADGPAAEILALIAGVGAVIGHNFPMWLNFKGGKGMATTIGLIIAAVPVVGGMACLTWLVIAAIFRYSSLAALVALALAPAYAYILGYPNAALAFLVLGILGWARHHQNVVRLVKGTESKIGGAKSA